MSTCSNPAFWSALSERERQEMRKERAIRESQIEARRLARARRRRRLRSLTLGLAAYIVTAAITTLLLALVATH